MSEKPAYAETVAMIVDIAYRQGAGRPVELSTGRLRALKFNSDDYSSPLQDIRQRSLDLHTGALRVRDTPGGISIEYVPGKRPAQFQETVGAAYADRRRMMGLTRQQVAARAQVSEGKIAELEDGRVTMITAVGGGYHAVGGYADVLRALEVQASAGPERLESLRRELNARAAGAKASTKLRGLEGAAATWQCWQAAKPDPEVHGVVEWLYGDKEGPFVGEARVDRSKDLLRREEWSSPLIWWRPITPEDLR